MHLFASVVEPELTPHDWLTYRIDNFVFKLQRMSLFVHSSSESISHTVHLFGTYVLLVRARGENERPQKTQKTIRQRDFVRLKRIRVSTGLGQLEFDRTTLTMVSDGVA